MSVFEFDVSDSFAPYDNDVQGNKFNGLEYDDVLTDGLFLDETFLLSSFEILDDGLLLEEGFAPEHFCVVSDSIFSSDSFLPSASLLFSAVQIAHRKKVTPVDIYWVALDVVHGPDVFYEELSETFFLFSLDIIANMYFDTLYDDFFVDLYPPYQTFVDVARIMFVSSFDYFCSVDNSIQEYRLNNFCDDHVFVFPLPIRGFPVLVSDRLSLRDPVMLAHTRTIDEALALVEACGSVWQGQEDLAEVFVAYDENLLEKYYDHILAESIAFVVTNDWYSELQLLADDPLCFNESPTTFSTQYRILMESFIASEVASLAFACAESAEDSFSVDHDSLCRQLFVDIVQDSCEALASSDFQIGVFEKLLDSLVSYEVIEEQHERV